MSDALELDTEATPEEVAELKAGIQRMFEETARIDARIESNQAEIDRLKAETRVILAQLRRG